MNAKGNCCRCPLPPVFTQVSPEDGSVRFALELTTPACPIKDEFERKARDYVAELDWVQQVRGVPVPVLSLARKEECDPCPMRK
jgi:hypothetical protein